MAWFFLGALLSYMRDVINFKFIGFVLLQVY